MPGILLRWNVPVYNREAQQIKMNAYSYVITDIVGACTLMRLADISHLLTSLGGGRKASPRNAEAVQIFNRPKGIITILGPKRLQESNLRPTWRWGEKGRSHRCGTSHVIVYPTKSLKPELHQTPPEKLWRFSRYTGAVPFPRGRPNVAILIRGTVR